MDAAPVLTVEDIDCRLIEAAQRGDRSALDALVRRHDRLVRSIVYSTLGHPGLVDDVAQHVWTRVCEQIGSLEDPARWRGWLCTTARNAAIDAGQKAARDRKRQSSADGIELVGDTQSDPARSVMQTEQHRRVLNAIRGLPPIYREPFLLRHMEDWSYAQIGEALSLPVDTVETRLVRARRLLRSALADLNVQRNEGHERGI
ncbi:MAG TPA: RNA polymerase sigma factor [Phycisphaerae bacterium]|nr:RNA polymerase sigma factor [Phycisphaerae bacterium]